MNIREVVVLSGVRTAIADFGHCVIGSVVHSDRRDMYMSRVAALKGGLPVETPVPAVREMLKKANVAIEDIDIWEANEAFAAQALTVSNELGLDPEKVNPNGSGIGLGHPIGATGAVLTVKALYELKRMAVATRLSLCV